MATDYVDIGNTFSETLHNLLGWSTPLPGSTGGSYGGIAPGSCRAIWFLNDPVDLPSASLTMNFGDGNETLWYKHLEGIANDAFDVYVNGVLVDQILEVSQTEQWVVHYVTAAEVGGFPAGQQVVEFVATGDAWDMFDTFGQVCFDEVWIGLEDPVAIQEGSWGEVKALFR